MNIRKLFFALFVLILFSCTSHKTPDTTPAPVLPIEKLSASQQIQCLDVLAVAQYPKEIRSVPNQYGIGIFLEAFSKPELALNAIKKELAAGRGHIRVNLLWYDNHNFGDKDIPFITKWSKTLDAVCLSAPGRLQIAPFTEHKVKNPDKYLAIVKANAPNCGRPVNSAWTGGGGALTSNPAYENEVHGSTNCPKSNVPCSYSYDGTNSVDSDVTDKLAKNSHAKRFCMWHPAFNLKLSMKDTTPRPQRIKEANKRKPSEKLLKSVYTLFSGKGLTNFPKNWIWKSHAEKHSVNDTRGDKPVLISPIREQKKNGKWKPFSLKLNGKVVCKLPYYDVFDGGGYRYYANKWGYECASAVTELMMGTQRKWGTVNPAFRDGSYR